MSVRELHEEPARYQFRATPSEGQTMTVREFHDKAMDALDRGLRAERDGNAVAATALFEEAFGAEREALAVFLAAGIAETEPTRSVLARSAANLAIRANLLREAERMAAIGLAGEPPDAIATELRDAMERATFHQHMHAHGRTMCMDELQMILAGPGIAEGLVPYSAMNDRVQMTESLIIRGVERKKDMAFRKSGRVKKEIAAVAVPFVQAMDRGSFAVTLRFGTSSQVGMDLGADGPFIRLVVDDVLQGLAAIERNDMDALERQIPQADYRQHFMAAAEQILPDGKAVTGVGLIVRRQGVDCPTSLQRAPQLEHEAGAAGHTKLPKKPNGPQAEPTEAITGTLLFADGLKNRIRIYTSETDYCDIRVADAQDDAVRQLYKREVVATVVMRKGRAVLEHLVAAQVG